MRVIGVLITLFSICRINLANYGGHDLFTSLGQLNELWKNEIEVVRNMEKAIQNMDDMKASLVKYIKSHKEAQLNQEPNFDYLGQPINGYLMIRHVALGWQEIREQFFKAENETRQIFDELRDREKEKLPDEHDIHGAAYGLARLHSLYSLNSTQMIENGVIEAKIKNGIHALSEPSVLKLTAWDLDLIARQGKVQGLYNTMVDFYGVLVDKFQNEEASNEKPFETFMASKRNLTDIQLDIRNAKILHDETLIRRGSRSGARTHDLPLDPKLRKKKKFKKKTFELKDPITDEERAENHRELEMPEVKQKADLQKELLCTGVTFRTANDTKDLFCTYAHNNSPWLRLGPMKVEIQSKEPYIAVLRELMYPHECDNLTRFLGPHLDFPPGRMNPRHQINDWTMKNAWPHEAHNIHLEKMTRRVEHITGLRASSFKEESDAFMCGNYGIGGHYGTHPDFSKWDPNAFRDATSRVNRISTVMTVLDAPIAGGATVWPFLGVSIFPEKGSAAFWFNLKSDGRPDYLTLHAACPVLLGQKWIGNKWIGYTPQWKNRPCALSPKTRQYGPFR